MILLFTALRFIVTAALSYYLAGFLYNNFFYPGRLIAPHTQLIIAFIGGVLFTYLIAILAHRGMWF